MVTTISDGVDCHPVSRLNGSDRYHNRKPSATDVDLSNTTRQLSRKGERAGLNRVVNYGRVEG